MSLDEALEQYGALVIHLPWRITRDQEESAVAMALDRRSVRQDPPGGLSGPRCYILCFFERTEPFPPLFRP